MSSNNSDTNGMAMGLGLLAVAALFLWIILYVMAALFTAVLSVVSLCALWKPLKIGRHVITPSEAWWFLGRGIIGSFVLPIITVIAARMFEVDIEPDWQIHIVVIGYILGALGGEWVLHTISEAEAKEEAMKAPPAPRPHVSPPRMTYQGKPFEYATWDDEDADPYK